MTIGIDASRAVSSKKTGTEHYASQIIYNISKIDKVNQYILYAENMPSQDSELYNLPKNFTWKIIPFGYLWTQIRLSYEMLFHKNEIDVLFVPAHTIPLIHPKKTVVTIHDLGFEYFPELYDKKPIGPNNFIIKFLLNTLITIFTLGKYKNSEYDYHRFAMRNAVKNATSLIAISEFTKKDIINKYGANQNKISVIYHGVDEKYTQKNTKNKIEIDKLTNKFVPYIYFIGRIEKKKNIKRLLEAFINLKKRKKIKEKLVLAGMPGLGYDEIKKVINNSQDNIKNDIIELGYVSDNDHIKYLQSASIFIFPSLFEGFGMPIIEAFSTGTPVICSKVASLPEIANNAAIYIDPYNSKNIEESIYDLITNKDLKNKLIKLGQKRAKNFSWEKAANQTLDIIKKTAKN